MSKRGGKKARFSSNAWNERAPSADWRSRPRKRVLVSGERKRKLLEEAEKARLAFETWLPSPIETVRPVVKWGGRATFIQRAKADAAAAAIIEAARPAPDAGD